LGGRAKGGAASRDEADAEITRGQALEDEGRLEAAEAAFRAAIEADPAYPRAYMNLGNALQKLRRAQDAEAAHREAVRLDPAYVPAWFNLATVLIGEARWDEARRVLDRVLELKPDLADAAVLLGMAWEGEGNLVKASEALQRAVAIRPDLAGAWSNLGALLVLRKLPLEGEQALRRALEIDPDLASAHASIAELEMGRGRLGAAAMGFERALALRPTDPDIWGAYLFSLNLRHDVDPAFVAAEHRRFGSMMAARAEPASARARPARRKGRRPLRVGYVSGDLLAHPVAWFLMPVLRNHDRGEVQSYCYSSGHVDAVTERVRAVTDHWRPIAKRSDDDVLRLIDADEIDILVDLSGHTPRNRLAVFARRAAPVQACWLGYLNTTGLATMDYRITDAFTDPPGMTESLHTEQLARLPHSQWAYVPHTEGATPREAPRAPGEPIVFGSFNQMSKLSDGCLDLWAEVLSQVPDARLRVHAVPDAVASGDVLARLEARGVARSRVEMRGRMLTGEYLAALADVDIALDAFPYNGGTTTLDTYWMSVPMVALAGARGISRGSFSVASSAQLEELVVHDRAGFVARNVALARDAGERTRLRRTIRGRLQESPVMDAVRFTRDLEALYRRWTDG
jgi:predicted O-linked N-acetylglucosamine transferase (SPINDLY family)